MFLQPALGVAATDDGDAEGYCMMQAWTDSSTRIVVRQRYELMPTINGSQNAIVPLGVPFPALGLNGVMIGIASRSLTASVALGIVTRTSKADPEDMGTWDTTGLIGTDKSFGATAEDWNSGVNARCPGDCP
jgi:hypothetical protein